MPLIDTPRPEQITVHNIPGFVIDRTPDFFAANRVYRIGRKVIDNHPGMDEYIGSLLSEFQDARRCTIFIAPQKNQPGAEPALEHLKTVNLDERGRLSVDDGEHRIEGTNSVLRAFTDRTPTLIDHDLGIKLVFSDLDSESEQGDIYPLERDGQTGAVAIMPFYYRKPELPSGVVVIEGPDLRGRGSELEGCPRTYWSASLAMAASAQISFQLTHKVDPLTKLAKRIDFEVDFAGGVKKMMEGTLNNMCMLIVDIDYFKRVNDTLGHDAGDVVLRWVANEIQELVRPSDRVSRRMQLPESVCCRWGGEEFGVLLKDINSRVDAITVMERIRGSISEMVVRLTEEETRIAVVNLEKSLMEKGTSEDEIEKRVVSLRSRLQDGIRVTCSIGGTYVDSERLLYYLATVPKDQSPAITSGIIYRQVFGVSDGALQQAKNGGRDQCRFEQTCL